MDNRDVLSKIRSAREKIGLTEYIFETDDMFLRTIDQELAYSNRTGDTLYSPGWGQLKLLITEIQALLLFWDPLKVPELKVVYAGAASGDHITFLSEMFPVVSFFLYDNRPFRIPQEQDLGEISLSDREILSLLPGASQRRRNIFVFQQYFENKEAAALAGRGDIFFFSDIREGGQEEEGGYEVIVQGLLLQKRWVEIMKPYQCHLKLAIHHVIERNEDVFPYLTGYILYQPFTRKNSAETRLVPLKNTKGEYITGNYDSKSYESMLFYHNAVRRVQKIYKDPVAGRTDLLTIDGQGLDNHYDCILMLWVLDRYLSFTNVQRSPDQDGRLREVIALSKVARNELNAVISASGVGKPKTLTQLRAEASRR